MRHVFVLLTLASLNACTYGAGSWPLTPEVESAAGAAALGLVALIGAPSTRLQVQGKVTAADDGSPLSGISIVVWQSGVPFDESTVADTRSDASGRYSLSLAEGRLCKKNYWVGVVANPRFFPRFGPSEIHCAGKDLTVDFQLERRGV